MIQPDWPSFRLAVEGTVLDTFPEDMLLKYGIPDDEDLIIERLLEEGIEKCPECGCWIESGEIIHDRDWEVIGCQACYVGEMEERE